MVKIISWNVNGFNSPSMNVMTTETKKKRKNKEDIEKYILYPEFNNESNLYKLITEYNPDIICLSETRCQNFEQINNLLKNEFEYNYNAWNIAERKGYSGVAVFSKIKFYDLGIIPGLEEDNQGRYNLLDFQDFILINAYVPNTGSFSKISDNLTDKETYRKDVWDINIKEYLEKLKNKEIKKINDL